MPKPTRPSPRIQVERLEQREVFSVGLDPYFGSDGFESNFYDYGGLGQDAELFLMPGGSIRVGTIHYSPSSYTVQVSLPNASWPQGVSFIGEAFSDFTVLPDGRFVTVGGPINGTDGRPTGDDFYVRRFLSNNAPDPTFGVNGKVEVDFSKPGDVRDDFPDTVVATPDGDLLVYGRSAPADTSLNNSDYALARLNPDGSLDTALGGDGKVEFPRAGGYFMHMEVRPDGKIVAAGNAVIGSWPDLTSDVALYRLNPDGSFDATFGAGGKVVTDLGGRDWVRSIALTPAGGVVVAAQRDHGGVPDGSSFGPAVLAWYGGAGNLIRTTTLAERIVPWSVELLPLSGGALVYGATLDDGRSSRAIVGKFDAAGRPDTAFAPGGAVTLTDGTDINKLHDLAATPLGRVTVLAEGNSEYLARLVEVGTVQNIPTFADARSLWPTVQAGPDRVLEIPIGSRMGGYGTPTGTVTVTMTYDESGHWLNLGTVALDANGVARVTTDLPEGTGTLRVSYSGDAVHAEGSWGYWVRFDRASTTTRLSATATALQFGQPVTLTATVTQFPLSLNGQTVPTYGPTTGTVTFRDGTTVLGTAAVGADGKATLSLPSMRLGNRRITATYSGDAGNKGSSATPLNIAVTQAVSRVSLSSSANPSAVGQTVTFRATVRTDFGVPAIGRVVFKSGDTLIGNVPVNGAGVATMTASLPAGRHTITAEYSGSSTVRSSVSPVLTQQVGAATPSATQTALTSAVANPVYGQPVALTATVTAPSGTPTGRVMFLDGTTVLGSADVGPDGKAVLSAKLNPGYRQLRAVYHGVNGFLGSTSNVLKFTVARASTRVSAVATPTDPVQAQPIVLAVTVRPAYQGTPVGTVTVKRGTVVLGTTKLDGNGRATIRLPMGLPAGQQLLRIEYGGSSTFLGSTAELTLDV